MPKIKSITETWLVTEGSVGISILPDYQVMTWQCPQKLVGGRKYITEVLHNGREVYSQDSETFTEAFNKHQTICTKLEKLSKEEYERKHSLIKECIDAELILNTPLGLVLSAEAEKIWNRNFTLFLDSLHE